MPRETSPRVRMGNTPRFSAGCCVSLSALAVECDSAGPRPRLVLQAGSVWLTGVPTPLAIGSPGYS